MPPLYAVAVVLAAVALLIPRQRPVSPAAMTAVVFLVILGIFGGAFILTFFAVVLAAWAGQL